MGIIAKAYLPKPPLAPLELCWISVDALVDFFIRSSIKLMPISKQKKVEILGALDAGMKDAETVVFVNFHKLPGKDLTSFRKQLRESGVTYYVAKKTLVKRALDAKKVTGTQPEFPGELALAWGTDPIAPAKGVYEFAKTHKDQVTLMGGVYLGAYMSKEEITALAAIPGREQLLGQFVGMINESIARVVRAMNERAIKMDAGTPQVEASAAIEATPVVAEAAPEAKAEVAVEAPKEDATPAVAEAMEATPEAPAAA